MPYGGKVTKLPGIVREVNTSRATIEFPTYNKKISVPQYFIHSEIQDLNKEQMLKIETWYLKKNRVIPLYSHTMMGH